MARDDHSTTRILRRSTSIPRMTADGSGFTIKLDYEIHPQPRYGHGKPPHRRIESILARSNSDYAKVLHSFAGLHDSVTRIPVQADAGQPIRPHWNNTWFEGIDGLSVYGFLATRKPKRYVEVGSGNSTKFAKQAIRDHGLPTRITSIDPYPRAEINSICDEIVRRPLEDTDLSIFDTLEAGDVALVDNSHRVFTNSDATVVFLDVMPRLKPGVLLGIHDIMLPDDYPPHWMERFYSEQYVLAAYLLAEGKMFDVVLPSYFVGSQPDLKSILHPVWSRLPGANPSGSSFWLQIR
jgi:hypothetical protein